MKNQYEEELKIVNQIMRTPKTKKNIEKLEALHKKFYDSFGYDSKIHCESCIHYSQGKCKNYENKTKGQVYSLIDTHLTRFCSFIELKGVKVNKEDSMYSLFDFYGVLGEK
jgi:hypothetical protein